MSGPELVTLAHGNGGRLMRELIDEIFARHLSNPALRADCDAVPLDLPPKMEPVITTDGFIVEPLQFPGGDIGKLAVHGTVNDLAVSGAEPRYMTLGVMVEEGLPLATLDAIVASLAEAAAAAGVAVVAGDTKVVPRGHGGGLYLTSTGVGLRARGCALDIGAIRPGDAVLVSGPVGDHGVAVMLAREQFDLSGNLESDCASLVPFCAPLATMPGVRFMRDATRGGLATVAHEIARATGNNVLLDEAAIPVRDEVQGVCEILGYDPYYLACEGRAVAVSAPEVAGEILTLWQGLPDGDAAAIIGGIGEAGGRVILRTQIGGERFLDELEEDALPRIC